MKQYLIHKINSQKMSEPLMGIIEKDGNQYISSLVTYPVTIFSYGKTIKEAKSNLQDNLDDIYRNLQKDNNFSREYLEIKKIFETRLKNNKPLLSGMVIRIENKNGRLCTPLKIGKPSKK